MNTYKCAVCIILSTFMLTGCSLFERRPAVPDVEYLPIPEGYLQECALPSVPLDNGDLAEAFAKAYQCGEQGNKDKARIRNLPR